LTDIESRVAESFSVVFPTRAREEILTARRESFEEWDSLAGITLVALLSEQFQIEIDLMDLEELDSFESIVGYVDERTKAKS
jgi:acyl carrier protein